MTDAGVGSERVTPGSGTAEPASREEPRPSAWRWPMYAVGVAMTAYGMRGLLTVDAGSTQPVRWAAWFVGAVIVHDLVFTPLVFLMAVLAVGRVPRAYRPLVQGGLIVSGVLALVSLPFVGGFGQRADDPSALPLPYGRNLMIMIVLVWTAVAALAMVRARSRRR